MTTAYRLPLLLLTIASGLPLAAGAETVAADGLPAPLFTAGYDGEPDGRHGDAAVPPTQIKDVTYAPGVRGQAVVVGRNGNLEYPTDGNLVQEHGSLTLWYRPDWKPAEVDTSGANWHTLFSQPHGEPRAGSGALMFWFWGPSLRGDLSDKRDTYRTASAEGIDPERWSHLAFTWDVAQGSRMYRDGVPVALRSSDSESPIDPRHAGGFPELRNRIAAFRIGSLGGWAGAGGRIDEVRIYDRVLAPPQVLADLALVRPLSLDCPATYAPAGSDLHAAWALRNGAATAVDGGGAWRITDRQGAVVASGRMAGGPWQPGERRDFTATVVAAPAGEYRLTVEPAGGPAVGTSLWVLGDSGIPGSGDAREVARIDFSQDPPAGLVDGLVAHGTCRRGTVDGRGYLEAGEARNDRFAVRIELPAAGVPYLVEWDYPDDRLRSAELVAQEAGNPDNDYGLQTGIFCGDEYPLSSRVRTQRMVLWARATSTAFIFMTTRAGAPAAVSALRVSTLPGLPDARVHAAAPVDGWTRTLGVYFEDPSIGFDFGVAGQLMPDYEKTLDRLVAYMRWSGQNLLAYPTVWYQGRIGDGYQPRLHPAGFTDAILTKFAGHDLGFMPTINLQNIDLPADVTVTPERIADGSLHDTPVMIYADGKPNPGGWHGTLPNFNPLHPAVRAYVDRQIDDLLARHGGSPAFKGVVLHLTKHTIPWFGGLEAGYNDYTVAAFERASGISVPVDRADPQRGRLYAEWLLANAREPWIRWRCQALADWYRAIAARMAARRPDLRLSLCSYNPTISDHAGDPRFAEPGFARAITRESGIDPALLAGIPNLVLTQTIYPADYRWSSGEKWLERARPAIREDYRQPGLYELLGSAASPWINMHDRYFEEAVGGSAPLKAPWLREMPWRVATLNPNAEHVLAHYLVPLRFNDVLGFTKGGFLIGTCGAEERLAAFARAYRALPASRFADLPGAAAAGTTRARVLARPDGTWFYVANTERTTTTATVVFPGAPGALTDLAADAGVTATGARLTVELQPYELRAFRAPAGTVPTSCE